MVTIDLCMCVLLRNTMYYLNVRIALLLMGSYVLTVYLWAFSVTETVEPITSDHRNVYDLNKICRSILNVKNKIIIMNDFANVIIILLCRSATVIIYRYTR